MGLINQSWAGGAAQEKYKDGKKIQEVVSIMDAETHDKGYNTT